MSRPVYIYALTEPGQEWNIRYIGKVRQRDGESFGESLRRRWHKHLADVYLKSSNHKVNWLRKLKKQGARPGYCLLDIADEGSWQELERYYIRIFRSAGFRLTNSTDGGDGSVGYKHTVETIEKIRLLKTRPNKPRLVVGLATKHVSRSESLKGHLVSEQTRRKIAARLVGRTLPQATREKISASITGMSYNLTDEQREQRAERMRGNGLAIGNKHTEEWKDSNSERMKGNQHALGVKFSEIRLQQHSEAIKKSWENRIREREYCLRGHKLTPENTEIGTDGRRRCKTCRHNRYLERKRLKNGI